MNIFWNKLSKPFNVLAPMDGVTDFVFRQMIVKLGRPDVFFTEFTPCDGIVSKGKENLLFNFKFLLNEKPIVAQIWGANPVNFYKTAKLVKKLGFSGIDINMGCPDRATIKYGACAALINNPKLAQDIIKATKEGAEGIPVSVKTRIGFTKENINKWISYLLKQELAALTVHLRTADELSNPAAHWELMPEIIALRNKIAPKTLIIGNGDLYSLKDIEEKHRQYGCDGYMVGRGILANPWLFNKSVIPEEISIKTKLETYLKHVELYTKTWGKKRNFENIKKFCRAYVHGFPEASNMRQDFVKTKSAEELIKKISSYITNTTKESRSS